MCWREGCPGLDHWQRTIDRQLLLKVKTEMRSASSQGRLARYRAPLLSAVEALKLAGEAEENKIAEVTP
jgi:hypothetical protein